MFDYSSLYPSSMISENISHDSKVWTKEYDLHDTLIDESGERCDDMNHLECCDEIMYKYDNLPGYNMWILNTTHIVGKEKMAILNLQWKRFALDIKFVECTISRR